jgi:hypothetical protein
MKKSFWAILGIIVFCTSICLTGSVSGVKPGFEMTDGTGTVVAVDGQISSGEWDDTFIYRLYAGNSTSINIYRVKWVGISSTWYDQWVLEIFNDNTNNPNDYIQICYDSTLDGGAAPKADDYLINYTGHSTITQFKGTGSNWTSSNDLDVKAASTLGTSPYGNYTHWITEINIQNEWESTADRIAAYDASTNTTYMWPPQTSSNVPNDYGLAELSYEVVPEGFSVGLTVVLSVAAVIICAWFLPKRNKLEVFKSKI